MKHTFTLSGKLNDKEQRFLDAAYAGKVINIMGRKYTVTGISVLDGSKRVNGCSLSNEHTYAVVQRPTKYTIEVESI